MGVKISRIEKEFIFRKIQDNLIPLKIMFEKTETTVTLARFSETEIFFDCGDADISHIRQYGELTVFFTFENSYHTFASKIRSITGNIIGIKQPENVYKNLQRQYERMKAQDNVSVYFTTKGKRINIDFPKTRGVHFIENATFSDNFDNSSIDGLLKTFRKKMDGRVSDNKIVMMRNRIPATYEENLMAKTGKIIWLPKIEDGFVIKSVFPEKIVLTQKDLMSYEEEAGTPKSSIGNKIRNLLDKKLSKGYFSQLYCPLLYNVYLVGYIYLHTDAESQKTIDMHLLTYVYEFSKILCFSLKKNGYFKAIDSHDIDYDVPLIDISASGLLFAHNEKTLSLDLPLQSRLTVTLKIKVRKIEILCEVTRKYRDNNTFYYALKYLKITPEDFRFIFEFIYGKTYIPEDDENRTDLLSSRLSGM
ncbi:MAG: PilZ domain-containing protein [Spirochaetales bacterium]|nr:PilZ domain-containing protein [Spirochaetales bacterium]